jgi:4-hydroxybenzoate polyprenyltransferase
VQGSLQKTEPQSIFAVGLDDSLLKTDLLLEKLVVLLAKQPWHVISLLGVLFRGPLALKKWLHRNVSLDYSTLPIRQEVVEQVKSAKLRGERTLLLSASLQEDVEGVSSVLNIFDESVGSQQKNFKGREKTDYLFKNYPESHKTYVGNSFSDLEVWSRCEKIVAINPSTLIHQKIKSFRKETHIISDQKDLVFAILKQLRTHQWVKNLLVFIPAFAAHRFFEFLPWWLSLRAFIAFSLSASAVYVFNDLCDLLHDRAHSSKKHRPLASGKLPLKIGVILIPMCLLGSFAFAWGLPSNLSLILATYLTMNLFYSYWVKEWLSIDVVFLSVFYTLRILAGGAASDIRVSEWLLSFSTFFFFGMAMIKRCSELKRQTQLSLVERTGRRAYSQQDFIPVLALGVTASILSILVLSLYMSTGEVQKLYSKPKFLWLLNPCLLFWINRIWLLGARGLVNEDPIVFAIKDKTTWAVVVTMLAIIGVSI